MGYELPAFLEEFTDSTSGCPKLNPGTTAYTIWIGNNDLGGDALLSDSHTGTDSAPVSLTNVTSCITSVMESLYEKVGARYFILQNLGPIEKAPIYVDNGSYAKANRFWPTKEIQYMGNGTRIEERMRSMVWATNEILKYKVPVLVATKLKDASVAIFDSHGFIQDIMNRPEKYLTGPKPLNTTGYNVQCPTAGWDGCMWIPSV